MVHVHGCACVRLCVQLHVCVFVCVSIPVWVSVRWCPTQRRSQPLPCPPQALLWVHIPACLRGCSLDGLDEQHTERFPSESPQRLALLSAPGQEVPLCRGWMRRTRFCCLSSLPRSPSLPAPDAPQCRFNIRAVLYTESRSGPGPWLESGTRAAKVPVPAGGSSPCPALSSPSPEHKPGQGRQQALCHCPVLSVH